jgi:hypothetical protein
MNLTVIRVPLIILIILTLLPSRVKAQEKLYQTVKGKVIDEDSNGPVVGANVYIPGDELILGSSTDASGEFKIENVPVGRINLIISSIGYEERLLNNIMVGSAKEVVITITLRESLIQLQDVIITDKSHPSETNNEMVQVSGKTFSVEETKRYAGTINDPARAVTAFAGVQGDPEGSNHIVVRGNSPNTVQWRMEGIEIPNPNHFSEEGSSGGAINILNSTILANSDFYTGAFSAEYGNVLGSVFDMQMRKGNREKREYSVGVGVLGTDITMEGPFSNNGQSSYLINYRYSTLAILDNLGLVDFGGVPKYQDLSFKLHLPTEKAGIFTLFGIGGYSHIREEVEEDDTEEIIAKDNFTSSMGTVNLGHLLFVSENSSFDSYLGISYNGSGYHLEEKNDLNDFEETFDDALGKISYRLGTTFNTKVNTRNTLRTGVNYQLFSFDFEQAYLNSENIWEINLADQGNAGLFRSFITWKHRINDKLTLVSGINYQKLSLNNEHVVEPRFSAKYQIDKRQSFFGGLGWHSQMSPLPVYYASINGNPSFRPNMNLEFMKARHYVAGYDRILNNNLFFKVELYYQDLYDVPVENDSESSFSLLNSVSGFTDKELINEGTGTNYGIELTLERYFSKQYYFLVSGSVYNSRYTALDGMERNTKFNGKHAFNILFGKEYYLKGNSNRIISLNSRFTLAGGYWYTPLLLEESMEKGEGVYDEVRQNSIRGDEFIRLDLSASYSWNRPKTRQEIKLEVQNLSNHQARTMEYYNDLTQEQEFSYQLSLFPVILYTIEF